ncbi:MAG: endonuclease/exonuclease/phosphatase family protein [Polyangiaceae bacterium]|nr:endonuclease/exonuclease/phosphatase family protein [Polyangiaceae bacterium]
MRLSTWNCRIGAFRRKAARVARFKPDVLIVPEMEELEGELFLDGDHQPTFRQRCSGPGWSRGLGVLSYTGIELEPAFHASEAIAGFWPFTARRGDLRFQVAAVWTFKEEAKPREAYLQAHAGIDHYRGWIKQLPTVLLGDFNVDASRDHRQWADLIARTESLDLVSAYHHFFAEVPGSERRATHFHGGKPNSKFHLDYCFLPRDWADRSLHVRVGAHEDWSDVSDHVPLIVDVDV